MKKTQKKTSPKLKKTEKKTIDYNVIELYLSDFELYTMGTQKTMKPNTKQHLTTISKWYYDFLKSKLDTNYDEIKYIRVTKDLKLRVVIHTKLFFHDIEEEWKQEYVDLPPDQDYPFYLDTKTNKLLLTKNVFKKGTDVSQYPKKQQDKIESMLDNTYELLTPKATLNFYTKQVIHR